MRGVPVWIPVERNRTERQETLSSAFKVPLNEALSPPFLLSGQQWKTVVGLSSFQLWMRQIVWLLKRDTDEKQRNMQAQSVLPRCNLKKDKHINWPHYLSNFSSLIFFYPFCYSIIVRPKNWAQFTQQTNKQTAQSESLLTLCEPMGQFSWMACNDDYFWQTHECHLM